MSSPQLDEAGRGFSFRSDGPLDMRMDQSSGVAAAELVNQRSEAELAALFRENGEGRLSGRIARAVVAARPITSTQQLADVVAAAVPAAVRRKGHPARRVFQALRIEVNDELGELATALPVALSSLAVGGVCAVISYHSGEDRLTKQTFAEFATGGCVCPPGFPACAAPWPATASSSAARARRRRPRSPRTHARRALACAPWCGPRPTDGAALRISGARRRRAVTARLHASRPRRPSLRHRPVAQREADSSVGATIEIVALVLVVGSLLAVVIGQAVLANDQVQMSALQHELSLEQSTHRQAELQVANLETPQRIVGDATKAGMVHPAQVIELPYVSLNAPIATPNVTAAPAPTTTTTAPPATTTSTTSRLHHFRERIHHAMSVTTRPDVRRARAGTARRTAARGGVRGDADVARKADRSAATARGGSATPGRPPGRPPGPTRRAPTDDPDRSRPTQRPTTTKRPDPGATASRPGKKSSRQHGRSWATGTFVRRVRLVRLILVLALVLMMARLVQIQVLQAGSYAGGGARRVLDHGSPPVAARRDLRPRRVAPRALGGHRRRGGGRLSGGSTRCRRHWRSSPMLHVPATTLAAELHRHSGYVVLAKQLSKSTGRRSRRMPSRHHLDRRCEAGRAQRRTWPHRSSASPMPRGRAPLGSSTATTTSWPARNGKETIMESPSGVTLPQSPVTNQVATKPGTGIELTLDTQLQYESEQALAKAIVSSDAVSGTAVVMDVKTGQILSMANLAATHPGAIGATPPASATPSGGVVPIGPNDAVNEAPSNLAVTQLYEPGSVFKLVTFSAALQERTDQPQLGVHRARSDPAGRLDVPRRRAAPDRAVDRHPDPGPVLEHRDLGDRAGSRRDAGCSIRSRRSVSASRPGWTSRASLRASWPPRPTGSRPTTSPSRSARWTQSARSRSSTPTTPWPTEAPSSHRSSSRPP